VILRVTNMISPLRGRFVVEQHAVRNKHVVRLAVIDAVPVRSNLADHIRTTRVKGSFFSFLRACGGPNISELPAW